MSLAFFFHDLYKVCTEGHMTVPFTFNFSKSTSDWCATCITYNSCSGSLNFCHLRNQSSAHCKLKQEEKLDQKFRDGRMNYAHRGSLVQQTEVRIWLTFISISILAELSLFCLASPHCPCSSLPCRMRSHHLQDAVLPGFGILTIGPWTPAELAGLTPLAHAVCH